MTRRIGCSAMVGLLFFCWALRGRAGRALEIDEFDDVAVGIADIGAAADEHAGAAILFLENLNAFGRQALQRFVVDLRRHLECRMYFVPAGGILRDRILGKRQIEEIIARAHEDDAVGAGDFAEAEDLGIEFLRAIQVLHRDRKVQNAFDFRHGHPIRANFWRGRATAPASRTTIIRIKELGCLEHDPEKWKPVFGNDHAQTKIQDYDPMDRSLVAVTRWDSARISGCAAGSRSPSPAEKPVMRSTSLFQVRSMMPSGRGMA